MMSKVDYPLVTIMIPTYNQAGIIHRAIESALAQDYPNLEVIVADDNSPDNTKEAVSKYMPDTRLKYFKNEKNLGRVGNYRKSLEKYARGEWVVNCDGDDYYIDNHFVTEVMELIQEYRDQNIVFAQGGKIMSFSNAEKFDIPSISKFHQIIDGKEYFLNRIKDNFFTHMATLYRRELALSINFYSIDITSADRESFFRLALHGKVILIKKAYGKWIGHGENFSLKSDINTIAKNYRYITSASNYAQEFGFSKDLIANWKRLMTLNYFSDWLNKIGSSDKTFYTKANHTMALIKYLWHHHRNLLKSHILILTILKIPAKWIYYRN